MWGSGSRNSCATSRRWSLSAISTGCAGRVSPRAPSRSAPASATPAAAQHLSPTYPHLARILGPHRGLADPQHGHDRRQRRQRLAHRGHAAGADRAGAPRSPCAAATSGASCRSRISSSTTASRTCGAGEFVESHLGPAPGPNTLPRRLQDLQAAGRGHLVRLRRASRHGRGRQDHARPASPLAAWRRRRSARRTPRPR